MLQNSLKKTANKLFINRKIIFPNINMYVLFFATFCHNNLLIFYTNLDVQAILRFKFAEVQNFLKNDTCSF